MLYKPLILSIMPGQRLVMNSQDIKQHNNHDDKPIATIRYPGPVVIHGKNVVFIQTDMYPLVVMGKPNSHLHIQRPTDQRFDLLNLQDAGDTPSIELHTRKVFDHGISHFPHEAMVIYPVDRYE